MPQLSPQPHCFLLDHHHDNDTGAFPDNNCCFALGQTISFGSERSTDFMPRFLTPDEIFAHDLYCLQPFWPQLCLFSLTSTKGTCATIVRNIQILCHLDSIYLSILHTRRSKLCTWCHETPPGYWPVARASRRSISCSGLTLLSCAIDVLARLSTLQDMIRPSVDERCIAQRLLRSNCQISTTIGGNTIRRAVADKVVMPLACTTKQQYIDLHF